jgi:hypothetical protein
MLPFKNFIKEEALKFQPPAGAVAAAKKAIEWKEKYPNEVKAMTRTGWVRARQLANGDKISYDILKRMAAFNRHRKNSKINPEKKDRPWRDNGYVAWLGWGGDAGVDWAMKMSKKTREAEESEKLKEKKALNEKTELAGWEDGGTYANSKFKILEFIGPDELESKLGTRKCLEIEKISESRTSDSVQKTFMSLNANDVNELREFLEDYSTEKDTPNLK